jgi:hypothetical protein
MTTIDKDVSNYSLSELMAIVGLNDLDPKSIMDKTYPLIEKYEVSNPSLSIFFKDIQSQLLRFSQGLYDESIKGDAIYPFGEKEVDDRYENEYLKQSDKNQTDKITERKQKIDVFGDNHLPMTREQLGVNDTFNVSVKQDSLNPNLKNTISRFVNLDSQYRQISGLGNISTSYTLDLSDTLKNVLSMRLYSYQIPFSWYVIDTVYNNTCLWITNGDKNVPITIPPGNYTSNEFVSQLNKSFTDASFVFTTSPASFNNKNGKITLNLYGGTIKTSNYNFTITTSSLITFFDFTANLVCQENCINNNNYLDQSLGWLMGYRSPYENVIEGGNVASAVLDLTGTKYLILAIDDFNQNHVNNSLVSITEYNSTIKTPYYASPDLPKVCVTLDNTETNSNLNNLIIEENLTSLLEDQGNLTNNGLLLTGKYQTSFYKKEIFLPSAPRTLTQAQLYSINEINKNQNSTNYRSKAPTTSDILAIIPIKTSGVSTGTVLVEFSGSLQDNIRTYFGPVNIERLAVKLLNDKGHIINLNGLDWVITLICDCLYQY